MRKPPPWVSVLIVLLAYAIAGYINQPTGPAVSPVTHNEVFQ